ncbi:hypothetical protein QUF70_14925, partial [Desulfobacterales bacterium HSG17]|nr:hypothetical protein [Desulfobacterales bacterium HSG17]
IIVNAKTFDVKGSRDHSLVPRMSNFYIGRYNVTKFDHEKFNTHNGSIRIEGKKIVIDYYLQKNAAFHGKQSILQNYLDVLMTAGAQLQLKGPYYYIFKLIKNGRETWIKVDPGNYDGKRYELIIVEKAKMVQKVLTDGSQMAARDPKDVEGSLDHTLVSRMPDFYIGQYKKTQSSHARFKTNNGMIKVEGHKFVIDYYIHPGKIPPGKIQLLRNYYNAMDKIGAKLLLKGAYYYVFAVNKNGTETWIKVDPGNYDGKRYTLTIVENTGEPAGKQLRNKNQNIIKTDILQMTGLSAADRIIRTATLQMTGLKAEDRIIRTSTLQMTGLSATDRIIRTATLQMTGLKAEDRIIRTSTLQMTGLSAADRIIRTDTLRMTGFNN